MKKVYAIFIGIILICSFLGVINPIGADFEIEKQVTFDEHYERSSCAFKSSNGTYYLFYARADNLEKRTGGDVDDESYMIYFKKSTNKGVTWSTETLVDVERPVGFNMRGPSAFEDGSGVIHLYIDGGTSGSNKFVMHVTSNNGGATWSVPTGVYVNGTTGSESYGATRIGKANVIYGGGSAHYMVAEMGGEPYLRFSKSLDNGLTWSSFVSISPGSTWYVPKISRIDSILYVVASKGNAGQIWMFRSTDYGNTWNAGSKIAGSDTPWTDWDPAAISKLADGRFVLVWAPNVSTDGQQLKISYSANGGVTWSSPQNLTAGKYNSEEWWDYWPHILVDGNRNYIFYTSERNNAGTGKDGGHIWMFMPFPESDKIPVNSIISIVANNLAKKNPNKED